MSITIKDVAEHAGVAVSTVSRVLNGKDRVDPKTRERIIKSIEDLNYVRNPLAASIKTGKSRFIMAVVPDLVNDFYASVVCGVEEIASEKGFYTLIYTTNNQYSKRHNVYNAELQQLAEGIILIPSMSNYSAYSRIDKPCVTIDSVPSNYDSYSVDVDNYKGSVLLMNEVISYGHKKIAIISGPQMFIMGLDRLRGYLESLNINGIPIRDDYIKLGDWYEDDGYRLTDELLNLPDPPTAIYAANNLICNGCVECLKDRDIEIGKDISLVAFDDTLVSKYTTPGITVIQRPTNEMGMVGAKMLFSLIEHHPEKIPAKAVCMDVTIIRRNSIVRLN